MELLGRGALLLAFLAALYAPIAAIAGDRFHHGAGDVRVQQELNQYST